MLKSGFPAPKTGMANLWIMSKLLTELTSRLHRAKRWALSEKAAPVKPHWGVRLFD